MNEIDGLLRELNHRVNNNFQIVVSLMNLKKRLLPVERQNDIRFIEEHVQSMAVAYRLIYATGLILEVPALDLVADVVLGLRLIAKVAAERIDLELSGLVGMLNLDQAIALALYLAVALPPYFDQARSGGGHASLKAALVANRMELAITGVAGRPVETDFLRERLMVAYVSQLGATQVVGSEVPSHRICFDVAQARTGGSGPMQRPIKSCRAGLTAIRLPAFPAGFRTGTRSRRIPGWAGRRPR